MPPNVAGLKYPSSRVLLPRTRLAYIHLRNMLSDAKRDRSARVSGYVAVWLPEEHIVLYLRAGEVVNATQRDRTGSRALPIAHAIERVPVAPEYGEITFCEAADEQLAIMFASYAAPADPWPEGMEVADPAQLFPYLNAMTFDGAVEIVAQDTVNYLVFHHGTVERAFLGATHHGTLIDRVSKLFTREGRMGGMELRRWPSPIELPTQAPPALVQAYRELLTGLVGRLVESGRDSAPAIAEHARTNLAPTHPVLASFGFDGKPGREPLTETEPLTAAVAALVKEIVWTAADHETLPPDQLLKELTWERRHMFQSAGFYDLMPWKVV